MAVIREAAPTAGVDVPEMGLGATTMGVTAAVVPGVAVDDGA